MKKTILQTSLLTGLCFVLSCNVVTDKNTTDMKAPVAIKIPKELTLHNHTRVDNYFWLNDRENPEVIAYLEAENKYSKEQLKNTEGLQKELFDEITGKIVKDDASVPYKSNGYWYYARYEDGKEYPIYCRKKETLESEEIIILDVNTLAEGHPYYSVGGMSISPDNKTLAFGVDTVSRRIYNVNFKNLETNEISTEVIMNTTGGATWANDNKTVFYTQKDLNTLRSHKIFKHEFGTGKSTEVFHETDDTFGTYVYKSKSKEYLIIGSYSTLSTEYQILSANTPNEKFKVFAPRERDLEYSIAHFEGDFYVLTNLDAKNFRVMKTPVNKTEKENWVEIIPHRDDVRVEGIELFSDYLVVEERENGLNKLRIINTRTKAEHYLEFTEDAYSAFTTTNIEFNTTKLRYGYESLTTPFSTIEYDMETKEKTVLKETTVLGDFDKNDYKSERVWATAKDGTKVPVSLVYKKGIKKEGRNPLLQYAYGSYGSSMDPYFSISRLSLLDRGFVFAIAHIRGGEDLGRQWYEDGKLLKKKNTFTDFIDCSEFLIAEGFTSKETLFAMGGSAGGLLMGAVANMRPDLYKGMVAQVPFVDVISTMIDETIPLTTGEYDEWGNPNVKEYYEYILSYSPYDNVVKKDYPNMLVTTGLHDSQVQYWEPAKWVAKLRDYKTDNNTLLLHTNMDTGHGGASGRFEPFKEVALEYAFLLNLVKGASKN
jgi:oligopeptidase B